jgi:hypothetical protein
MLHRHTPTNHARLVMLQLHQALKVAAALEPEHLEQIDWKLGETPVDLLAVFDGMRADLDAIEANIIAYRSCVAAMRAAIIAEY